MSGTLCFSRVVSVLVKIPITSSIGGIAELPKIRMLDLSKLDAPNWMLSAKTDPFPPLNLDKD